MSIHNRAAYQRINPNMSLKHDNTPKKACLAFKAGDGVIFKPVDEKQLKIISTYWPELSPSRILLDLIQGRSFSLNLQHSLATLTVTLVYK